MAKTLRTLAAGSGAVLLLGVGSMALADTEHDTSGVDVTVGITRSRSPACSR